jgi:adenylate kinase family enzyme
MMLIGSGGAGKSTLARQLGKKLYIEVIHLDTIMWKPGWRFMEREEQIKIQQALVQKESWIIDGNYGGTMDIRFEKADTIIFLDYSRYLCLYRALKRMIQYKNMTRPDMIEGNDERLDFTFLKWIWNYPKQKRPQIMERLNEFSKEKQVVILSTPKEAERFLEKIEKRD